MGRVPAVAAAQDNVDQVPLPFVNNMDNTMYCIVFLYCNNMDFTYAERGAGRVAINQGGASLIEQAAGN